MKSARILATLCVIGAATPAFAQYYTFEDLPSLYWSDSYAATIGGQTDIGGYYGPNLVFSSGVQGIHTSTGYPAASPTLEVYDSNISNPTIGFSLGYAASTVSFWYSSLYGATAVAYNSKGGVVETLALPSNVNSVGTMGITSYVALSDGTSDITSVVLTDKSGLGNFMTLDNLDVVPDASSSFTLLGLAGLSLLAFRKQMVKQ